MSIGNNLNKLPSLPARSNKGKVAFQGSKESKILTQAAKLSTNSLAPMFISTLGIMAFRPPIIWSDKKTPKNDRIFTGAWLFSLSAVSLGVFSALQGPINNAADKIALKTFGLKTPAKETIKKFGNVFNALTNEQTTAKGLTKIKQANGLSKALAFLGLGVIVANTTTLLVTRYLERGMNKVSKKYLGKTATGKPEKVETPKEKAKRQRTDKIIAGSLLSLVTLAATHKLTKNANGSSIVTKAINGAYNQVDKVLHLSDKGNNIANSIQKKSQDSNSKLGKMLKNFGSDVDPKILNDNMKKTLEITDKLSEKELNGKLSQFNKGHFDWTYASMATNVVTRPAILIPAKQYYSAANSTCSEGLSLLSTMLVDPLVKKAMPYTRNLMGAKTDTEKVGADFITNQLIKNIGIICIGMGFVNNTVSRGVLNLYKKISGTDKKADDKKQVATKKEVQTEKA